jgi:pyridoxal 5'-phosphate synthase pdxT subunit
VDSFEADLDIEPLQKATHSTAPYHAIFIRAPIIESLRAGVEILSALPDGRIVAAQQGRLLATSFHPELTRDTRFHEYFLTLADGPAGQPDL